MILPGGDVIPEMRSEPAAQIFPPAAREAVQFSRARTAASYQLQSWQPLPPGLAWYSQMLCENLPPRASPSSSPQRWAAQSFKNKSLVLDKRTTSTGNAGMNLVLRQGVLKDGEGYTFTLHITDLTTGEEGYASIDLLPNRPPFGGTCRLFPHKPLEALMAKVHFECKGESKPATPSFFFRQSPPQGRWGPFATRLCMGQAQVLASRTPNLQPCATVRPQRAAFQNPPSSNLSGGAQCPSTPLAGVNHFQAPPPGCGRGPRQPPRRTRLL